MPSPVPQELTIGQVAQRSGVATSALRFYEDQGLIASLRTAGNQRRYPRSVLRRVAVIRAAQALGLSLRKIGKALDTLPGDRSPSRADWARLSKAWRTHLEVRVAALERLKSDLDGCIGCGCLSLETCRLLNRDDAAAEDGVDGSWLISRSEGNLSPD